MELFGMASACAWDQIQIQYIDSTQLLLDLDRVKIDQRFRATFNSRILMQQ